MTAKNIIVFSLIIFSYESIAKKCEYRVSGLRFYKKTEKNLLKNYQEVFNGVPLKIKLNKKNDKITIFEDSFNCKEIKIFLKKIGFKSVHRKEDPNEINERSNRILRKPMLMLAPEESDE